MRAFGEKKMLIQLLAWIPSVGLSIICYLQIYVNSLYMTSNEIKITP